VTAIRREEEGEGVGKEGGREMEEGDLAGGRDNFQNYWWKRDLHF